MGDAADTVLLPTEGMSARDLGRAIGNATRHYQSIRSTNALNVYGSRLSSPREKCSFEILAVETGLESHDN